MSITVVHQPAAGTTEKPVRKRREVATGTAMVVAKTVANDTYLVVADSQKELEDEFAGLYFTTDSTGNVLLAPSFPPAFLLKLPTLNNTLNQCVEAMEVNIDGTGHEFVAEDDKDKVDLGEEAILKDFFNEPFPGISFVSMRRNLRRDLESVGWGFLEVLRNVGGDVVGMRNVLCRSIRLVKYDAEVTVTREIMRGGKLTEMTYSARERRYAQRLGPGVGGGTNVYYKEFGATRDLDKATGEWTEQGKTLPAEKRATELLYFSVNPDPDSQYGLPRWINELPSILGSRKAEEQNLEFFDAGGVPPAIIFISGGELAKGADQQLKLLLSGQNKATKRIAVVSAQSNEGSTETAGKVKVQVERFGAETINDSMYSNYDARAQLHVRSSFRLPGLFFGDADGVNFATAYTAYMVAEAQVFQPERTEFDEVINKRIVPALKCTKTKFKSKGISLKNVDAQLAALGLMKPLITPESFIENVNTISNLSAEFDKKAADAAAAAAAAPPPGAAGGDPFAPGSPKVPIPGEEGKVSATIGRNPGGAKPTIKGVTELDEPREPTEPMLKTFKSMKDLMTLAQTWMRSQNLGPSALPVSKRETERVVAEVDALEGGEKTIFNQLVAAHLYGRTDSDIVDLVSAHEHAH